MTAATKDVQLRIRARDYSQKTFKDLQAAYKGLISVMEVQDEEAKAGTASARDLEKAYDRLADAGKQLLKIDALTKTFEAQSKALVELSQKTADAKTKLKQMSDEFEASEKKTKKQETALARQARAVEKLGTAEQKRSDTVRRISAELDRYGVSTDNIATAQADIATDVVRVNSALAKQEAAIESLASNQAAAKLRKDRQAEADAAEKAGQRVVDSLRRQAEESLATARGFRTLGRVTVQTAGDVSSLGSNLQQIFTPSEAARRTMGGLANQVEELGRQVSQRGREVRDLKNDIRELDAAQRRATGIANLIDQFRNQVAALRVARSEYNAAKAQVADLSAQLQVAGANTAELGQKLQVAQQRLQNATRDFRSLNQAARQSQSALRDAGVATNKLTEAESKLVATSMQVVSAANKAGEAIRKQGEESRKSGSMLDRLASSSRESLSLYQRVRGEVIALATAYVGLQGAINLAGGAVDAYKLREQSLIKVSTAVGQSQQALSAEWQYMLGLADALGISINLLAPSYTKFAVASKAAGMTMQETRYIFESFAKSAAVLQLSQADIEGVFRAIEQVISKGQVYAEELRGQLGERLPGAVALFAEATGRSVAELNKALENGEVSAREIINFAGTNAKRIDAQLAVANKSVAAAEGRLATAQTLFKLAIADAGFIDAYASAIRKITEFLRSEDGKNLAKGIAEGFVAIAEAVSWSADNIDTITRAIVVLLSLKFGLWLVGAAAMALKLGRDAAIGAKSLLTLAGGMGTATVATGGLSRSLSFLRVAMGALLRVIPGIGLALLAWDLGTLIYQTDLGKKVIDGFVDTLKKVPATLEAVLMTIPALVADIGLALSSGLIDAIGREAILKWHRMVEDFVREIPVVGELLANITKNLSEQFQKDNTDFFSNTKRVWDDAQRDWESVNQKMVETDQQKYTDMLRQAKDFANRMKAATGGPVPLADPEGFKGVPFKDPSRQADFMFTQDPGTGVTVRERQIAALTKQFEKLETAAKKADKASKEMEQRKNLPGRLALVDEEFAPKMKEAQGIGGPEGEKLVARLKEIILLRKQAETREFKAQGVGDENEKINAVRKLQEEYDRLYATIEKKATGIDPSKSFEERTASVLQQMNVQYDQLIAKAERLGTVEGKALAKKFETLKATNGEYLIEKAKMDELARLQRETNAAIETKKSLVEQVNSLREAGTISETEQVARIIQTNQALNTGILANLAALEQFALTAQASMTPEKFAQINAEIAAMRAGLTDVTGTFTEMDTQVVQGMLDGMGVALTSITDSLVDVVTGTASWGDVFKNLGASVAKFFADLMIKLAQAILTQMILNAISGAGWGGISSAATSMGGVAPAAAGAMHNGGTVGDRSSGSGFQSRGMNPGWFANAPRFHSGGFPGLAADEVPIIAQRGEQILSKDDPDNLMNRPAAQPSAASPQNISVINAIDSSSMVSEGVATPAGTKAIINMIKANRTSIKSALG